MQIFVAWLEAKGAINLVMLKRNAHNYIPKYV